MKFKRINVDTVRCLITEEELTKNGLEVDDFLLNDGKTDEFLREIINRAEAEVGYKVSGGNISIQVSVLPEHVVALTFSEKPGLGIVNMLENLKAAVENLSKNVRQEPETQSREAVKDKEEGQPEDASKSNGDTKRRTDGQIPIADVQERTNSLIKAGQADYQIQFDSLDNFWNYCKAIRLELPVENSLYKLEKENAYFLLMKKAPMDDKQLCRLLSASLEFNSAIYSHSGTRAYIQEHGDCLIPDGAIQKMQEIS